ncbi:MAG: EAL domain-containing protein [Clostridiales Family XIII bacterium]|jgi:diguanylate cyclase (GGDEF)-like protein|nr:EAL domain-containing protein [Clostridiales Family XIII bacterium]
MIKKTYATGSSGKGSILRKILAPLLAVMIFQAFLVYGMFFLLGITDELKSNAINLLTEKTTNQKEQFESNMLQRWGNLGGVPEIINDALFETMQDSGGGLAAFAVNESLQAQFLGTIAEEIIYLMHRNNVTGAFLILNGAEKNDFKQGLYFRNANPFANPGDYSDISAERAPEALLREMEMPVGIHWEPVFTFSAEDAGDAKNAYYYEPFLAAAAYPQLPEDSLGYWSEPFFLNEDHTNDSLVITYSQPLLLDGQVYGILGVEVSKRFIESALYAPELNVLAESGYAVVREEGGSSGPERSLYKPVLLYGLYLNSIAREPSLIFSEGKNGLREFENADSEKQVYAVCQNLALYPEKSPFADEQWAVLGIQSEDALLGFSNQVKTLMLTMFFASLTVGVIGIVIVAKMITIPIGSLARQLRRKDPNKQITLDKLSILEIDELSDAIESLSAKVAGANRKLADILEMAETSIAVFEYHNRNNNQIIYTKQFAQTVNIPEDKNAIGLLPFMSFMRKLKPTKESEEEEGKDYIYRITCNNEEHWLRLFKIRDSARLTGVITDVSKEVRDRKRLEYDRDYDMLTDVYNRRAFHTKIADCFQEQEKMGIAAIIMLDLDNLKNLNDTYGHDYGDKYIRLTADTLKAFNTVNTVVARLAGDEFIVFLHGFQNKDQIRVICDMIKSDMNRAFMNLPDGSGTTVQISAGIAWYPDDSTSSEELIRYADFAMYMVKKTNKGQFKEFDFGVYNKHSYLLYSKNELDLILEKELIYYQFQPIVDARTGNIFAYEALMRPQGETIQNPSAFISLAKAHSRLEKIETLTFFHAMEAFSKLPASMTNCKLFINSISNQKMSIEDEERFAERYSEHMSRIVCEITEEEERDDECMAEKIAFMQKYSQELALDDFGVGYNSESVMLQYAPKYIKIDMSIIKNIHEDANRQMLTQNLITYGKAAGIRVLAEGVELKEEMEYLIGAGIDYMQGYYLCQPMTAPPLDLPEIKSEIRNLQGG